MLAYFSSESDLRRMFSRHLEFLKQRNIAEKHKLRLRGWARNRGDEGAGEIYQEIDSIVLEHKRERAIRYNFVRVNRNGTNSESIENVDKNKHATN